MTCILSKAPILYQAIYYKNIIFSPFTKITRVKNYGYFSPNKSDAMVEKRFRLKDNITDDYKVIYRENEVLRKTIIFSHYSGWCSLLCGIFYNGYNIINDPPLQTKEIEGAFSVVKPESELSRKLFKIMIIFLPIVLISMVRIMPLRIYHSSSQKLYKIVYINEILRTKGNIQIFGEGCAIPMFSRSKLMADSLFKINGRITLLDRDCFAVQAAREKMIRRIK